MSAPATRPLVVEGLRLLTMVGRGGEGEVWEARDAQDRRRALKLVRPDCLASPEETIARGRWLVRIDHPALVRVHRSGLVSGGVLRSAPARASRMRSQPPPVAEDHGLDGWGFVEMDFVAGESLASAEADPGVLERLEPLSEALDLLHAGTWSDGVPLVHRDVKPANIVEDADGRFVLVDPSTLRGLDADDVTRVGTPLFRAPEVLAGDTTTAADVYSFAATIIALSTGLRGRDLAALLRNPDIPGMPRGVRQALSPVPGERPVSCRAVLEQGETMTLPVLLPWDRDRSGENTGSGDGDAGGRGAGGGIGDEGEAHEVTGTGEWLATEDGLLVQAPEAAPASMPVQPPPAPAPRVRTWPLPAPVSGAGAVPASGGGAAPAPYPPQQHQPQQWPPPQQHRRPAEPQPPGAWGQAGPASGGPRVRPVAGLCWALAAIALFFPPAVLLILGVLEPPALLMAAGAPVAGHLLLHLLLGRSLLQAVVLPPVSWSGLVAERLGGSVLRRAWSRALVLPGLTALIAGVPVAAGARAQAVGVLSVHPEFTFENAGLLAAGGVGMLLLGLAAAALDGSAGSFFRLGGLPLWILGAATLVALCSLGLIPAAVVGRARPLIRLAGDTLASLTEINRPPSGAGPTGPDPRGR